MLLLEEIQSLFLVTSTLSRVRFHLLVTENVHTDVFLSILFFLVIFIQLDLVVSVLFSGGCNQSSFELVFVVLELLYRWVNAVFHAGKCSSSSFS